MPTTGVLADEEQYERRVKEYRAVMLATSDKHSICTRAKFAKDFDRKIITEFCQGVTHHRSGYNDPPDFLIISLIRLLFTEDIPTEIEDEIESTLTNFVFWPHGPQHADACKNLGFLTENHIFMLLSSAVLFRQKLLMRGDKRKIHVSELEYQLLRCYLRAHVEGPGRGVFEALSIVYLPYTLCALFNIVDFAMDMELSNLAMSLADNIITQLMHATSAAGICCLSASTRTYRRFRERTYDHNIDGFLYCMTGIHPGASSQSESLKLEKETDMTAARASAAAANGTVSMSGTAIAAETEDLGTHGTPRVCGGSVYDVKVGVIPVSALPEVPVSDRLSTAPACMVPPTIPDITLLPPDHKKFLWPSKLGDFVCCLENYTPTTAAFVVYGRQGFRQLRVNSSIEALHDYLSNYIPTAVGSVLKPYIVSKALKSCSHPSAAAQKSLAAVNNSWNVKKAASGGGSVAASTGKSSPVGGSSVSSAPPSSIMSLRSGSVQSMSVNSVSMNLKSYNHAFEQKNTEGFSAFQLELLPFFWSAGLLVHPMYAEGSLQYLSRYKLDKSGLIRLLAWVGVAALAKHKSWTLGHCYLDLTVNIFKQRNLVMSSLEKYNGGLTGYQQMPWMINLDGVGIWSQSGKGADNLLGVNISNTHMPVVTQRKNILIALYSTPVIFDHKTSINSLLFDPAVTLFFPCDTLLSNVAKTHAEEDSTASINLSSCCVPSAVEGHHQSWKPKSWWFGQRNNYFVGVCCTGRTTVEIPSRGCKEGKFSVSKNGPTVNLVQRKCSDRRHAWICVVGELADGEDKALSHKENSYKHFPSADDSSAGAGAGTMKAPALDVNVSGKSDRSYSRANATTESLNAKSVEFPSFAAFQNHCCANIHITETTVENAVRGHDRYTVNVRDDASRKFKLEVSDSEESPFL